MEGWTNRRSRYRRGGIADMSMWRVFQVIVAVVVVLLFVFWLTSGGAPPPARGTLWASTGMPVDPQVRRKVFHKHTTPKHNNNNNNNNNNNKFTPKSAPPLASPVNEVDHEEHSVRMERIEAIELFVLELRRFAEESSHRQEVQRVLEEVEQRADMRLKRMRSEESSARERTMSPRRKAMMAQHRAMLKQQGRHSLNAGLGYRSAQRAMAFDIREITEQIAPGSVEWVQEVFTKASDSVQLILLHRMDLPKVQERLDDMRDKDHPFRRKGRKEGDAEPR